MTSLVDAAEKGCQHVKAVYKGGTIRRHKWFAGGLGTSQLPQVSMNKRHVIQGGSSSGWGTIEREEALILHGYIWREPSEPLHNCTDVLLAVC